MIIISFSRSFIYSIQLYIDCDLKLGLLRPTSVDVSLDREIVEQRINKKAGEEKHIYLEELFWPLNTSGVGYKKGQIVNKNGPYANVVSINGMYGFLRCHADQLRYSD